MNVSLFPFLDYPCSVIVFCTLNSQIFSYGSCCPGCFQPGLVEGQMLELLQHPHRTDSLPSGPDQPRCCQEDDGTIRQKGISDGDICPICQEELLRKRLPVVHCRFVLEPGWCVKACVWSVVKEKLLRSDSVSFSILTPMFMQWRMPIVKVWMWKQRSHLLHEIVGWPSGQVRDRRHGEVSTMPGELWHV